MSRRKKNPEVAPFLLEIPEVGNVPIPNIQHGDMYQATFAKNAANEWMCIVFTIASGDLTAADEDAFALQARANFQCMLKEGLIKENRE